MMYNNKTGKYELCEWLMNGDWYEDENRLLYILPPFDAIADNEGPDGPIMDAINKIGREKNRNPTREEATDLGLIYMANGLKRFSEEDGYYHA